MNFPLLLSKRLINLIKSSNKKQTYQIIRSYSLETKPAINPKEITSKYTTRSHTCGTLRSTNVGENVVLCGWLEYQRMNRFLVLRDGYGRVQLLIKEEDAKTRDLLATVPLESILQVSGTVLSRPKEMRNKNQPTGDVEVLIDDFKVLNKVRVDLPFNVREFQKAKEPLRMQYRYLDLRFSQMQKNLRFRSKLLMKMREFLCQNEFVDVETPTLFKKTPGGAQEFLVPTRFPGEFYSLVQSPQQFKQILMAGAIDRYFQIARCYRDEGARSDRQPEFTQLDIEMSFTSMEGVTRLIEDLLRYCLEDVDFKTMTFEEASERFGSDKPDLTFDFELQNCTETFDERLDVIKNENFGAYYIQFPKSLRHNDKKLKELLRNVTNRYKNAKFVHNLFKNKETTLLDVIIEKNNIPDDPLLFLAFGDRDEARSLLGKLRVDYVDYLERQNISIRRSGLHFLWVVDFPLFELSEEGTIRSAHHPFTAPHPDDLRILKTDPLKVRGSSYDLVLNGSEIGGGSMRIHDPDLQLEILDVLRIDPSGMRHMVDMLGSGCPPHGGIALGLDRLLSVLLETDSIRDVMAFPKNFEGRDPMSGAPSRVDEEEKRLYHIQSVEKKT